MARTLADQAIVSGGTFLTTVFIARLIGVDQFGHYSLCILLILLVQNLQAAAIVAPMMAIRPQMSRYRVQSYDRALLEQSWVFSVGSALVLCTILLALPNVVKIKVGFDVLPFAVALLTSVLQDFQRRCAFARSDPLNALISDSIRFGGFSIALGVCSLARISIASATAMMWLLSATTLPSILYSLVTSKLLRADSGMRAYAARRHFHFSAWMTSHAFLQYLTTNAQFFFVGGVVSAGAVGALRAAMNLANLVNVVLLALENWVPVRMAQMARTAHQHDVARLAKIIVVLEILVFAPLIALSACFGDQLMHLVYARGYDRYGNLMFWWMCVNFVASVAIPVRSVLRTAERPKWVFYSQALACGFTLAVTPLAIARLGVSGGPVVLVASSTVFVMMAGFCMSRIQPSRGTPNRI